MGLVAAGVVGCEESAQPGFGCEDFCNSPGANTSSGVEQCVTNCRETDCEALCAVREATSDSDFDRQQCVSGCVQEIEDPTELVFFELRKAVARVTVDNEGFSFDYVPSVENSNPGGCTMSPTGIANASFQNRGDLFSFTDPRDGSNIWGLFDESKNTEWVGPGDGSATIACGPPEAPGVGRASDDFIICKLAWSGEASRVKFGSDGNVTRDKAHAKVDIFCLYADPDLDADAQLCPDDGDPCRVEFYFPPLNRCASERTTSVFHPIDCTRDDGTRGMCVVGECDEHGCGPEPCDDGDDCTYDYCAPDGAGWSCQAAPNGLVRKPDGTCT